MNNIPRYTDVTLLSSFVFFRVGKNCEKMLQKRETGPLNLQQPVLAAVIAIVYSGAYVPLLQNQSWVHSREQKRKKENKKLS